MTDTTHFEIASNWFKQLEQRDLDQLVSLYSDTQLSFHPTLWNEHIHSRGRARDYFVDFLAKRPQLHSYEGKILTLGEHCFLYSGTMNLGFGTESRDTQNVVKARFSFIWTKEADNQWRILHHHNSVVPSS